MKQNFQNLTVRCSTLVSGLKNVDLRLKTERQNQKQEYRIHDLLLKHSHLGILSWLQHTQKKCSPRLPSNKTADPLNLQGFEGQCQRIIKNYKPY